MCMRSASSRWLAPEPNDQACTDSCRSREWPTAPRRTDDEPMTTPRNIPEASPAHDQREIDAVVEVLQNNELSLGHRVLQMERRVAELLAKQHGVMVNSGTSALWLAVDLFDCAA